MVHYRNYVFNPHNGQATERKAQASKANQAGQITNANKCRGQTEMANARTDQALQQY